jgi:hypothetical protein
MTDGQSAAPPSRPQVERLVGVYDADGTLRGELAYWVGARIGRSHCALCDITHGLVRERSDWIACRSTLAVRFDTYHRNDQPAGIRDLLGPDLPAVVAETDQGLVKLLGPSGLAACDASPSRLAAALEEAIRREDLTWAAPER